MKWWVILLVNISVYMGISKFDHSALPVALQGSRPIKFTVHTSSTLPVEVLHQEEADAFYIKNFGNKKLGVR